MYKPSRFTAGMLVALQVASFDLYATGGKATLCKCKLTRQAQQQIPKLMKQQYKLLQPHIKDETVIDTLETTTFTSSDKKHTVEFWRDGKNAWRATVTDAAFGIDLGDFPVHQTDVSLEQWALAQDPVWQRQKLHVILEDKLPNGGVVLIGSKGLKGGGKLWQTLLVGLLGSFAPTNTLDKGLIGYFEGDCPDGWETYGSLTGRVPVGAGNYVGTETATYVAKDMGGTINEVLIREHLPSFRLKYWSDKTRYEGWIWHQSGRERYGGYRETDPLGSDMPHNNMPPYLVLNPCQKTKSDNYTNQSEFFSLQQNVDTINETHHSDFSTLQNNINNLQQVTSMLNGTHQVDFLSVQQSLALLQQQVLAIPQTTPRPHPAILPQRQPTPNNPPIVAQQIPTQYATVDKLYEYIIPSDTFTDPNGDILTLSATLSDGGNLPDWLEFVPDSREFLGYPQSEDTGIIKVKLTAADPDGAQASEVFFLVVRESTSNPTPKPTLEPISSSTLPNSNKEGSTSLFSQNNNILLIGVLSGISGGLCTALCAVGGYLFCKKKNQNSDVRGVEGQHNLGQVVGQGNLNKQIELQVRHKKTVHPNTGRESVGEQLEDDDIEMMYDEVYENKKESTSKKVLEILSEGQDLKPQPPKNTVNQNEDEILRQVLKRSETDH